VVAARRTVTKLGSSILAASIAVALPSITCAASASTALSWNPQAAAKYLDQRAAWWMSWPGSARDQGTSCISCHTALPYALSRPALENLLDEKGSSEQEAKLLDGVIKRVRLWSEAKPYYGDQAGANKASQSRGTESVLNALILSSADARRGKLSDDTRAAFRSMWALQEASGESKGAWPWLDFGNEPFEAKDSVFYGACLAAIAVGTAPESIRASGDLVDNVKALRDYLDREYTSQSLANQVVLLWASTKLPQLLTAKEQGAIIDAILGKQLDDGGWGLSSLVWSWKGTSVRSLVKLWAKSESPIFPAKSDGYATGLIVFALEQYGVTADNAHLQRGLAWLQHNQLPDGRWPGYSLNHALEASSPTKLFMGDAATAYAVLALTEIGQH